MSELTCEVYGKSVARDRGPDEENYDAFHADQKSGEIIVCDSVSSNIHPDRLEWIAIQDRPLSERVDLMIDEAQENGPKAPEDDLWRGPDDTTAAGLRPIL